jgi:hypothetical protein
LILTAAARLYDRHFVIDIDLETAKNRQSQTEDTMAEAVSLLMIEFLTWVSDRHRLFDEAAEAWRSSCPRQTIWEDAFIDGLIEIKNGSTQVQCEVTLTSRGRAVLDRNGNHKPTQTRGA